MDINFWAIGFGVIGLLFLILFILFSIREKSLWAGFVMSLTLSPILSLTAIPIIGLFGLVILYQYIPERIQFYIGAFFALLGNLAFGLVFLTH